MRNNKRLIKTTLTALAALTMATMTSTAFSETTEMEKCMGIVAPGKADGQTTIKGKKEDWIYLPAGQCMKFVGGKVLFEKKTK